MPVIHLGVREADGVAEAAATVDSTWGGDGYVEVGGDLSRRKFRMASVDVGPDDKLVTVTTTRPVGAAYWVDEPQIRVERFLTTGDPDPDFGSNGVAEFEPVPNMRDTYVYDVAVLADGRVLLLISPRPNYGQTGPGVLLLMLTADGSVDTGFADAGYLIPDFSPWACQGVKPYLREIEVNSAGAIVALAQRDSYYSCPRLGLVAQFDSQGSFVDAFGSSWRPLPNSGHYFAGLIDIDTQNRVLLHDYTADVAVRLAADGDPDPQFTPVPVPEQTNTSSSVFVDGYTGAIIVTAQAWGVLENGQDAATVDFYLPDGTPDPARPQAANPIPTVFEWGGYHNLKFRPNGEMVALDHTNSYLLLSATGEPVTDLRYSATGPEESWLFDLDSTGRMYRFDEHLNGRDSVVTRVAELGPVSEFSPECLADPVACFAPHVLFHPDEDFYPMDVNDFVNGSVLKWQGCRGSEMLVNANPTPESLRLHAAHSWDVADGFWDVVAVGLGGQFYCRPDDDSRLFAANEFTRLDKEQASNGALRAVGGTERLDLSQGFFLDWEDGRASGTTPQLYPAPLVGRFVDAPVYFERTDDRITYWFFYGYDPKAGWSWDDIDVIWDRYGIPHLGIDDINPIGIIDGVTAHEGDWEHITVDVAADGRPTHVSYAGHGCDEKRVPWADVDKTDGTHPHVYVAEGSHASYPDEIDLGETYCADDDYPSGQADETAFDPAS